MGGVAGGARAQLACLVTAVTFRGSRKSAVRGRCVMRTGLGQRSCPSISRLLVTLALVEAGDIHNDRVSERTQYNKLESHSAHKEPTIRRSD